MILLSWAFEHVVPGGAAVVGSFSDEALLEEVREQIVQVEASCPFHFILWFLLIDKT